ncbi:Hypothetical predicted protein [Lecanosticta acicola]|uniref:Uncharacterized protein n=1 Tax=Lecanosticta acicola TaxID=111012 RepID=A0AAI8YYV2_9PEZI|nr:Hypothetical predicted protein [Lecanosticta acicola]
MDTTTNHFGAAVFWLYIVAALAFTSIVIDTIVRLPAPSHAAFRKRHVAAFTILASVSFATLSFNMLHILVQSYRTWAAPRATAPLSIRTVREWSVTSTMFRDFGEAITEDETRYLWTQSALLVTLASCLYMGSQGLRKRIPRLWAFFALSQILPISFAQNLFYLALLRSGPPSHAIGIPRTATTGLIAAYCICLVAAPYSRGSPYLIPIILFARLLLLLPLHLPFVDDEARSAGDTFTPTRAQRIVASLSAVLVARQVYLIRQSGASLHDVFARALFGHPAVTTLGFDFFLSVVSSAVWNWTRPRDAGT